ncbi:TetR family transcriptional regulator [Pseudomonas sp. M47T1]|nr:TetR family transcriptional regulator [Pseudomonas sp. M47T1]
MPMPASHTPSNGPGRPKDLAKRDAILTAAKQLFLGQGYAGTSMDAVAALAGVSKLTVYGHFTDKETLFTAAVVATCEAQLPAPLFAFPAGAPVEEVLTRIGRGFQALISSEESVNLHRLIMTLGAQDPHLSAMFFEAGPLPILREMEALLDHIDRSGALRIDNPGYAAEHFFCMLKGAPNFRLLLGCAPALDDIEACGHVDEVVRVFMRAYRP